MNKITWEAICRHANMLNWKRAHGELSADFSRWKLGPSILMARNIS